MRTRRTLRAIDELAAASLIAVVAALRSSNRPPQGTREIEDRLPIVVANGRRMTLMRPWSFNVVSRSLV